jgi:hypothetical protein
MRCLRKSMMTKEKGYEVYEEEYDEYEGLKEL